MCGSAVRRQTYDTTNNREVLTVDAAAGKDLCILDNLHAMLVRIHVGRDGINFHPGEDAGGHLHRLEHAHAASVQDMRELGVEADCRIRGIFMFAVAVLA